MALSNSTNWSRTRDELITQALRNVNAIGTNETPETALVTETAIVLNNVVKSMQAEGMPLWRIATYSWVPTAGVGSYTIGEGGTLATAAPLKIVQAFRRRTIGSTTSDVPLDTKSYYDYNLLNNKNASGTPLLLSYREPGPSAAAAAQGTILLWPYPDSNFISGNSGIGEIHIFYQRPFDDMDAGTDHLDFPSFFNHAIVLSLTAAIAPMNGVPLAERAQMTKDAERERERAFAFNTEEGSVRFFPDPNYLMSLRGTRG